jgi:putative ABC transport system permease protein
MSPIQQPGLTVLRFWRFFTLRHIRGAWLQTALLLLILGLGVGTFLSIRIANRAAMEGFELFTETLRGSSDWIIESRGEGIPISTLRDIRKALGPTPASIYPVYEGTLTLPGGKSGSTASSTIIRLYGLDLVQIREIAERSVLPDEEDFWDMLREPNHLLIGSDLAELWNEPLGQSIQLLTHGEEKTFRIHAVLPESRDDGTPIPGNIAVMDLAALVQLFPEQLLSRIEILVPEGELRERHIEAVGQRLRTTFGDSLSIHSPETQTLQSAAMTAAFRLNLTVLSLIALLVGIYLIAQTLDATVSRRRREIATLRSLGLGPKEIYRLWLSEALLYGIAAALAGIFIGWALSSLTVEAVTTTIRTLYRDTVGAAAVLMPKDIFLAFALGIGGSLIAAWIPAKDAASTPPAQFLRLGKRIPPFPLFNHPWIGILSLILGASLLALPPWRQSIHLTIPIGGYAGAFLWLTGGTLVVVQLLKVAGIILGKLMPHSAVARLAAGRLIHPTSRHQLALAGFYVAIGMACSMSFLISSFEKTVTDWLTHRLRADIFVSTVGFQGSDQDERMPARLLDKIAADPAIRAMDRFRLVDTTINDMPTGLGGMSFDLLGSFQELLWIQPPDPQTEIPDGTIVGYANENLARRANISVGQTVRIATPVGERLVTISGIHADYARDNGLLIIDLPHLEEWFGIQSYDTAAIFLDTNTPALAFKEQLQERYRGLAIRDNPELMKTALGIFEQTFAVTKALQLIGILVALSGLVLSLISLLRESDKELSLQKTLGMTRHESALANAIEGIGIAACGISGGILLSVGLGYVMIFVINRQSFGWTLMPAYPVNVTFVLAGVLLAFSGVISYLTGSLYIKRWKPQPN